MEKFEFKTEKEKEVFVKCIELYGKYINTLYERKTIKNLTSIFNKWKVKDSSYHDFMARSIDLCQEGSELLVAIIDENDKLTREIEKGGLQYNVAFYKSEQYADLQKLQKVAEQIGEQISKGGDR